MAFFLLLAKKSQNFLCFDLKKDPNISQILLKLWLIGNRTSCRPFRSVIILVIKQIGLPQRVRPILLITRIITDRIGLHSVLLPLLIKFSVLFLPVKKPGGFKKNSKEEDYNMSNRCFTLSFSTF